MGDADALDLFTERQYKVDVRKFIGNPNVSALAGLGKKSPIELDLGMYFLLFDVCLAFAVPTKPTRQQISSVIEAIKQDYYFLTLEELIYVFGKAKSGTFGKHSWNGIDQAQIMGWLKEYVDIERTPIATSRQGGFVSETDHFAHGNEARRGAIRELKDSQYNKGEKGELDNIKLKEFYSLIPLEVVQARYPKVTVEWYLQANNDDLQQHFLADVLASKAKECGVTFEEYKAVYPNKKERDYLQEPNSKPIDTGDTIIVETLADRIGKAQRKEKANIVRYVSSLGLYETESMIEKTANNLYFLQKTDYGQYKQAVAKLEIEADTKRRAEKRAKRQRQYETKYKKRQTRPNTRHRQ